jgi:hypothetical protein
LVHFRNRKNKRNFIGKKKVVFINVQKTQSLELKEGWVIRIV